MAVVLNQRQCPLFLEDVGKQGTFFGYHIYWGVLLAFEFIGQPGTVKNYPFQSASRLQGRLFYFEGQGKLPVQTKLEFHIGQTDCILNRRD